MNTKGNLCICRLARSIDLPGRLRLQLDSSEKKPVSLIFVSPWRYVSVEYTCSCLLQRCAGANVLLVLRMHAGCCDSSAALPSLSAPVRVACPASSVRVFPSVSRWHNARCAMRCPVRIRREAGGSNQRERRRRRGQQQRRWLTHSLVSLVSLAVQSFPSLPLPVPFIRSIRSVRRIRLGGHQDVWSSAYYDGEEPCVQEQ
jgi:hypothetical protein